MTQEPYKRFLNGFLQDRKDGNRMRKGTSCSKNITIIKNTVEVNNLKIFCKIDSIGILDESDELSRRINR